MPMWLVTKVLGILFKKQENKGEQSPLNKWMMKKALMTALPASVRKQIGNVESIKEVVFPSGESQVEKLQKSLFPSAKQKQQAKLQDQLGQWTGGLLGSKDSTTKTTKTSTSNKSDGNPADLTQMITKAVLSLTKK